MSNLVKLFLFFVVATVVVTLSGCERNTTVTLVDKNSEWTFSYPTKYHNRISKENAFMSLIWPDNRSEGDTIFSNYYLCIENQKAQIKVNYRLSLFISPEMKGHNFYGNKRIIDAGKVRDKNDVFIYVDDFKYSYLDYGLIPIMEYEPEIYLLCVNSGNCEIALLDENMLTATISFPERYKACFSELIPAIPTFIKKYKTSYKKYQITMFDPS
ncbi:hypothetical protein ACM9HF_07455 [Colwellia sp. RE-S-Sl-9]